MELGLDVQLTGTKDFNGFLLEKPLRLDARIMVLTGRNGSGKTRFIESVSNGSTQISIDGSLLDNASVSYIKQSALNPNLGNVYNHSNSQNRLTAALSFYNSVKHDFDLPFDRGKSQAHDRRNEGSTLNYEQLYNLCSAISKKMDKPASELSHDDIILNYEEPSNNILGVQNISTIFNQYIQRQHLNKYNKWLNTVENEDVKFFSDVEFIDKFGDKPWIVINKILDETFDGKFKFNAPDENSKSYSFQASLINTEDGKDSVLSVQQLSSGEKTLLWLALTLFNTQYYEVEFTKAPKVLLIDEPDAFLHPKMVVKMYQALESFSKSFGSTVIISTHSPTTVALSPKDSVFLVENNNIKLIEKDEGIAELLDGVTQISISPDNRRQVFVESQYDADVYQSIYYKLMNSSKLIDPKISLSFVSSGPKMPSQQLMDKAKQILKVTDENLLSEFTKSINGIGNCVQVLGQVEALLNNDSKTVRGIIDWDLKNRPKKGISILAEDYAYSIENITLDPVCIILLLHVDKNYTMSDICGSEVNWHEFIENDQLLQVSIDRLISKVLGRDSNKDAVLAYTSGVKLYTDRDYLRMNGHALERKVKEKYPELNAYCKKGRDGDLKCTIVNKAMITLSNCKFIPVEYERVIADVQK
ncbi:ABC-type phosphate transport system, ATPase component [Vibrio antiquarius]|uniref:Uncharacterized protein n=2 Tax=Vibrio antiquarius (strain Ex25) TaxID=150340 RepID=A0ACA6QNH8_VIBAE|nr:ATP-binding protein [Vibrio antiquarius]ACY52057.1 hypothetical protein VEA_003897 [Vibrio antiquarius]EDN56378.1 ABC-type phosphate transport system, ATPase component [Vibrio antiquarius]